MKKPVFVTDYPKDIKAFYMRQNDDQKTVAAMDLLVPGIGEIIGEASGRKRLLVLQKRLLELGLDPRITGGIWICASTAAPATVDLAGV
jgi:asparaginyl-tRNA synthetase